MNEYHNVNADADIEATEIDVSRTFFNRVYNWMTSGLVLTGLVAWYIGTNEELLKTLLVNQGIFLFLMILTFGMVMALSFFLRRMSAPVAAFFFIAYAMLNGVTFSVLFVAYTATTIYAAFFVIAGMFGVTSLYGYMTKTDLSTIGGIAVMALIGVIIATIVNIFLASNGLYWILTYATLAIFVALTAYDTQKIKQIAGGMDEEGVYSDTGKKLAIIGALALYLDFINMFLMLLRIFGGRNR